MDRSRPAAARFWQYGQYRLYDFKEIEAQQEYVKALERELEKQRAGNKRIARDMLKFKRLCREAGLL